MVFRFVVVAGLRLAKVGKSASKCNITGPICPKLFFPFFKIYAANILNFSIQTIFLFLFLSFNFFFLV